MANEQAQPGVELLEKGNIVFFYRPKRHIKHPKSPDDLQRAYFMLLPDDQVGHKNRLFNIAHGVFPMIVPGKALPEERDWAFVEDVSQDPKAVLDALEKEVPAPQVPPGERVRPWARAAGQGRYVIVRHEGHTHLAYWLGEPRKVGEVQKELQIEPEASYVVSVKEPYAPSEIELEQKPDYPESLRRKFDGLGWVPIDPTSFLDYQYTQILLVGARRDVEKELGIRVDPRVENRAEREVLRMLHEEEKEAVREGVALLEPLTKGMWE